MFILQKTDADDTYNKLFYEIKKDLFQIEKEGFTTGHREKSIEHAGNSTHGKKSQFILRRGEWCYIYLIHF